MLCGQWPSVPNVWYCVLSIHGMALYACTCVYVYCICLVQCPANFVTHVIWKNALSRPSSRLGCMCSHPSTTACIHRYTILTAIFEVFLICSMSWSLHMSTSRTKIGMNKSRKVKNKPSSVLYSTWGCNYWASPFPDIYRVWLQQWYCLCSIAIVCTYTCTFTPCNLDLSVHSSHEVFHSHIQLTLQQSNRNIIMWLDT